ncbi:MAG: M48 family metalloprotease [Corticimicrobacter sp.]|uniref:M48 family metalloprotease n=1 Tax=Corticimicrobacter sp. TaxID=2678536 RepID=UPI0032D9C25B
MKFKLIASAVLVAGLSAGCMETANMGGLMDSGSKLMQAYNLSDQEVIDLSNQACAQMDQENRVAGKNSKYNQRLQRIVRPLAKDLNGQTPEFKVYLTDDVNAWAMANGCIRVYTGLMDKMNDDELRGVIGHEMGHVELGHSKRAMQTAYTLSAARDAVGASGSAAAVALSSSQLGDLTEALLNAQFSQSQETAADDYSFELLTERKLNTQGLVTAFQKLAELGGGESSIMSSHPGSNERAARMQAKIDAAK